MEGDNSRHSSIAAAVTKSPVFGAFPDQQLQTGSPGFGWVSRSSNYLHQGERAGQTR